MAEVTASLTNRTKQSFQSFGFVIFSFIADIISIVTAVQQQQMGRSGIGILALFLSTLTIAQILYITRRISAIRRNVWPLIVGIVYSAGILALCSRIWSGSNWWQWVLISLLIPVASLVFITWKYRKAAQEMQSPFTLDHLGQWFGFAAVGFVVDLMAIVGAVKAQDWGDIFAAIGLVLTLIVMASILFITRAESRASNQKGPLITGLFTSVGLTVAYLYIWIDLALWESLVFNMLVMSLALIIGLLRCATNQSDISISGTRTPTQNTKSTRRSAQGQSKESKTDTQKAPTKPRPEISPEATNQSRRQSGGDPGTSPGFTSPPKPNPNSPSFPGANASVFTGTTLPERQHDTEDLIHSPNFIPRESETTAFNKAKQDQPVYHRDTSHRQPQEDMAMPPSFKVSKPEEIEPKKSQESAGMQPSSDFFVVKNPSELPKKHDNLLTDPFSPLSNPKERRMLEDPQEANILKPNKPSLSEIIVNLLVSPRPVQKRHWEILPHVSEGTDEHSEQVKLPNPLLDLTSKLGKPDQNLTPDLGVTFAEPDNAIILGISPIFDPPPFPLSASKLEEQDKTPKIDLGLSSTKSSDDTKNSGIGTTPNQVETNMLDETLRTWRISEKQNPKEEGKQVNENTGWRSLLPDTTQAQDASSESTWPTQAAYLLKSASETETAFIRDRWKPGDPINIDSSEKSLNRQLVEKGYHQATLA